MDWPWPAYERLAGYCDWKLCHHLPVEVLAASMAASMPQLTVSIHAILINLVLLPARSHLPLQVCIRVLQALHVAVLRSAFTCGRSHLGAY